MVIKQPTCKSLVLSSFCRDFHIFVIKTSNNFKIIRVAATFLDSIFKCAVFQWRTCYTEWHTRDTTTIQGPASYRAVFRFAHVSPTWLLNKMFSDFEGWFWLYLKTTFVPNYAVYIIKPATNDLYFPLAVIIGFIGEKRVKALLAAVAQVIKKSNAKSSVFEFKI